MIKTTYRLFLVVFSLFYISCGKKENNIVPVNFPRDIINIEPNKDRITAKDFFDMKTLQFISIKSSKDTEYLYHTDKALFFLNKYILFDYKFAKKGYILDAKGKVQNVIDNFGVGPNEYYDIADIAINKRDSTINLFSKNNRTFFKYDLSGNLKSVEPLGLNVSNFMFSEKGELYIFSGFKPNKINDSIFNYNILSLTKNLEVTRKLQHFIPKKKGEELAILKYLNPFYFYNDDIFYAPFEADSIVNLSQSNDKYFLKYVINKGKYKYNWNANGGLNVDNYINKVFKGDLDDYILNVIPSLENSKHLFFSFLYKSSSYLARYEKETKRTKVIKVQGDLINMNSELPLICQPFYYSSDDEYYTSLATINELFMLFGKDYIYKKIDMTKEENIDEEKLFIFKFKIPKEK